MGISKMFDKVNLDEVRPTETVPRSPAKTAPGRLIQFGNELEEAQKQLDAYQGSLPTKRLDPKIIRTSSLRNRHEDAFKGSNWEQFKQDIALAGGNTQPIKVRPIDGPEAQYEIVFGHRRHRACLETEIPVLAMIEQISDKDLFESMTRENLGRNDLSVWEWGQHYRRGLEHGFYATQAQLAAANQMSEGHVAVCLQVAALPFEVVCLFSSPLDIQWRWGTKLAELHKHDAKSLRARAIALASVEPRPAAAKVFAALAGAASGGLGVKSFEIQRAGKRAALIESKGKVVSVKFAQGVIPARRLSELRSLVEGFLAQNSSDASL